MLEDALNLFFFLFEDRLLISFRILRRFGVNLELLHRGGRISDSGHDIRVGTLSVIKQPTEMILPNNGDFCRRGNRKDITDEWVIQPGMVDLDVKP
jgi:hypothetical protein